MDNIRGHKLTSGTEACVVGEGSEIAGMTFTNANEREVQELYVDGYIAHWKDFIGAHHVEPFRGSADAAQKLRVLADNNRSPLLGLVYMVSHNTDLSAAHSGESTAHALAEGMKAGAKKQLSDLVNKMGGNSAQANQAAAQLAPSALPGAQDVLREFQPAYVVVSPKQPDKWLNSANQAYVQALEDLGQAIGQLPDRIDNADPASKAAVDKATNALNAARAAHHAMGATIPNYSSGVDIQLESLLGEPINYAGKVIASVPVKPPPPPPPDATIPIKKNVNAAAQALCTSANSLRTKYPFSATATQDATIQDLNEIFAPGTGSLAQFVQTPDVAKVYLRQGHAWVQNPSFPGTFSQPFLDSLNNLLGFADALYSDGSNSPHFDYIVYLDGTGRVPAQLDVDGHIVAYNPKKGPASTRLVWPPTTGVATKLTVKAAQPLPIQDSGIWGLFRLLQAADKQEGNVFVFSMIQFANGSKVQLQDGKGNPVTVQIRIDSPTANSIFGRNYLTNLRCDSGWAVR
jgi:type VI protein secretion system component VasK